MNGSSDVVFVCAAAMKGRARSTMKERMLRIVTADLFVRGFDGRIGIGGVGDMCK